MMKARSGFTLAEMLIGVIMMSIVIAGIAFTVRSGFDLFTKADSNAVVINGVRFTADSFGRTVAPMLNVTNEVEILSADVSSLPAPASIPDDIHYVFLSEGSVVRRDSKGDHMFEGSEHIEDIRFSVSVSSEDLNENYMFRTEIRGENIKDPKAALDLEIESALYNKPLKKGAKVSDNFLGNILKVKASLYLDRLDLYDNDTRIKLNGLSVHRGTKIEAVYDVINQTGTSQETFDASEIEWFISGSVNAPLIITTDPNADENGHYWKLLSPDNTPIKTNVLNTVNKFRLDTGAVTTERETGALRCRVTPKVKLANGTVVAIGVPKWSEYVAVRKVSDPSEEFGTLLDVVDPSNPTANGTGDIFVTQVSTSGNENIFTVGSGHVLMKIGGPSSPGYGAGFVIQMKYDKFDNDRIYGAWAAGRESSSDIPSYTTVTSYSVILDSSIKANTIASMLFLNTRSNNPNFGKEKNNNPNEKDNDFRDIGYGVQYSPYHYPYGFFVSKFKDGDEIFGQNQNEPRPLGIYNESINNRAQDYYHPTYVNNSNFAFSSWTNRYRVMYTVLEYYDETQGKAYPRYIYRVRFLRNINDWDDSHIDPNDKLAEIKKTDPWCIGPRFHASEPMWFGDFIGTVNSTRTTNTTTIKVRNYFYTNNQNATVSRKIDMSSRIFYGLKNTVASPAVNSVIRKRLMDARAAEKNVNGTDLEASKTRIEAGQGGTVLADTYAKRYVGIKGTVKNTEHYVDSVTIYDLAFAPGFSINEIRSLMPANGKLYSIEETVSAEELAKIEDKDWYRSYRNMIAASDDDINKKVFGTSGKSAGDGNNGSRYYTAGDAGIYDLQHIKNNCSCPLHEELFKWMAGE